MEESKKLELSDDHLDKVAGGAGCETVGWCKHCQKETPMEDRSILICKVCGQPAQELMTVVIDAQ